MAFQRCKFLTIISCAFFLLLIAFPSQIRGEIQEEVAEKIKVVNARGAHYGVVVPGEAERNAILQRQTFQRYERLPVVDISARRFYVGSIEGNRVIVVMSGSGTINAAQSTQLLVSMFRVRGVIHYGRAGSANPKKLKIGDVAISRQFAHTGVWYWAKYGGDQESYAGDIANLTFSDYNVQKMNVQNYLQSVYFQPEVIYSKPEVGEAKFWFDVDRDMYNSAQQLEGVELDHCVQSAGFTAVCLRDKPTIKRVERAATSNMYLNNQAYRDFLCNRLGATSIDTESAAIAMVCESERKPFLTMRSITNYAGESPEGNDVTVIQKIWSNHARTLISALFKVLAKDHLNLPSAEFD